MSDEIDKRTLTCVTWKIRDYFSIPQRADTNITSPTFSFLNGEWRFRVFPNGERRNKTVGYVGIYVEKVDSVSKVPLSIVTIGIAYINQKKAQFYDAEFGKASFGCPQFISRLELSRIQHEKGSLKVYCAQETDSDSLDVACQTDLLEGVYTLSHDFRTLLNSEQKSDVTIKVEDQTFQAHRLILGARSSVFAAMFEHDMREKITGIIDIADCEPDAFRDFLEFIYTGDLSIENVTDLFSLADRYNVCDLRQICVDFMKENLHLETACSILDVTDRHNEEELKNLAREFIMKNIKKITSLQNWLSFMRKNPVLGTEILMSLIPEENTS